MTGARARRSVIIGAIALTLAASVGGCSSPSPSPSPSPPADAESATIVVFAAASLRDAFTTIGDDFAADHPGVDVRFTFAGSADLVTQIREGAPADVFASADTTTMQKAVDAGDIAGAPRVFATNTLTIVTPPDNPGEVNSFADLGKPGLQLVICAPQVPCGGATARIATAAGVTLTPVSEENSVADVLGKVTSGQADAGVVYRTDASIAGDQVADIPFAESAKAINRYPIAPVAGSAHADLADEFVDFVMSDRGLDLLTMAGFGGPPP